MRKFLTEFGIHTYTSFLNLVPIEYLELVKDDHYYHIYCIMSCPRISYDRDSIVKSKSGIALKMKIHEKDEYSVLEIPNLVLAEGLDHSKLDLICEYPYGELKVIIKDYEWLKSNRNIVKSDRLLIDSNTAIDLAKLRSEWEFELLYVGQAYGENGERIATDRLKSHEKLQRILTDCHHKYLDKKLYILLLEFTPQMQISMDGLSKAYSASKKEEDEHFNNVWNNPLEQKQIINITEAALINFFKPQYNVNFVENFPDEKHKGYKQYYDLDYNNVIVELDLDFGYFLRIKTETNQMFAYNNYLQYDLFNDVNRKNMYDIFVTQD